jgi:predicted molibdopterin-dependent oxidoreductase YjgC
MIRFRLDNKEFEAREGSTILESATEAGIHIPTLCHKDGLEHYSSCMVCLVRNNKTNSYIPSCSALVQPGMNIDASSETVIALRKKSVELLLSEHRAECEAPCRVVCPAGYNIPAMNRLLAEGRTKEAIELSLSGLNSSEIKCTTCPGYCENACRRKKIDDPVSIRNIQLFVFKHINKDDSLRLDTLSPEKLSKSKKKFSSRIGKLEDGEIKEWLKECKEDLLRIREITDFTTAAKESFACMHCDCRAAEDCRLRELAEEMKLKDPVGKVVNAHIFKKINLKTGLIFENAKCIKCGLCVRICKDDKDEPALCFINRGFVSIISEPLTEEFSSLLGTQTEKCINVCPTGALSSFKRK